MAPRQPGAGLPSRPLGNEALIIFWNLDRLTIRTAMTLFDKKQDLPAAFSRYRYLFRYIARYRWGWAALALISLLNVPFSLLQPWPMQVLFDHVLGAKPLSPAMAHVLSIVPGGDTPYGMLTWVVAGGLVVFAMNSVLDIAVTFGWIKVGQRMVYDFARDLFAKIQRLSVVFHTRNSVGDLMSRIIHDSWCINSIADSLVLKPIQVFITLSSMVIIMARIDFGMTLLSLGVAPFMAGSSFFLGRPVRAAARVSRENAARLQSHVQQTLSGIPVVQAFAQEERQHRRFLEHVDAAVRAEQRNTVVASIYNLGSGLIITLGTAAILWVGARHVLAGHLTVGMLLVFLSYLTSLHGQIRALSDIYRTLQQSGASMDRVMGILEAEEDVPVRANAAALTKVKGSIALESVTFGYEAGRALLQNVSFEAAPGETLAVVGPTGAGKSTLVSLIPRFFDPWSGCVRIDGHDARDLNLRSLRSQIGIVLQEPFLFPMSVAENIALGRAGASPDKLVAAAKAANAHSFIERMPQGYDTIIGERGATLSGGEGQRLSIARALLKDAPILILDEPTSAVDAETEALLLEALERLMAGRTTVVIAHRLSTIRNADRILVLQAGRVVQLGTHAQLLEEGGLYTTLHQIQSGAVSNG
jgi:ATP-binding cassette subfamily B protein